MAIIDTFTTIDYLRGREVGVRRRRDAAPPAGRVDEEDAALRRAQRRLAESGHGQPGTDAVDAAVGVGVGRSAAGHRRRHGRRRAETRRRRIDRRRRPRAQRRHAVRRFGVRRDVVVFVVVILSVVFLFVFFVALRFRDVEGVGGVAGLVATGHLLRP